jgi:Ni/Co efflux regulator RcnB
MNTSRLIARLSIAALLASSLATAAPQAGPGQEQNPRNGQPGQGHQQGSPQQGNQGHQQNGQPGQPAHSQQQNQQRPQQASNRHPQPPQDFAPVRQQFYDHRAQIGRGPDLPPGVRIEHGRPLPHGYGKRLDARALHGLPQYNGYEWRRVGSDVVLIAITTGIVYTILQGVLN